MSTQSSASFRHLLLPLVASLTLGLAPFVPEPHLMGKVRWILGGAEGMSVMDWFDAVLHGLPWVWLALATGVTLLRGIAAGSRAGAAAPPDAPGTP